MYIVFLPNKKRPYLNPDRDESLRGTTLIDYISPLKSDNGGCRYCYALGFHSKAQKCASTLAFVGLSPSPTRFVQT